MNDVKEDVELRPGTYRHFKGGFYSVIGVAKHVDDSANYVVYRALYGDRSLFIRPREEFADFVTRDGQVVRRFTFVQAEAEQELPENARW